MKRSSIKAQGFLNDVRHADTTAIFESGVFDGLMLDEIQITAVLKSADDIEKLIDMLRCSVPCFKRPKGVIK